MRCCRKRQELLIRYHTLCGQRIAEFLMCICSKSVLSNINHV
jgi:hypothetical protein